MGKIFYTFTNTHDGNLAYNSNDLKESVDKNRQKLANKYNFDKNKLISMNQVHGNNVVIVDKNSPNIIDFCDGLITNSKGLILMVMVADCIPILFMDKEKMVIAAVHAGRNSTFLKISQIVVEKMIKNFNCKSKNIEAIMGPSIKKCCYEVDEELINIVEKKFGKDFVYGKNIDLQGINKKILTNLGINKIKISNICTKCSKKPYFSYRVDKNCGRFSGLIKILS